jgi:hypothetical protein
MFLRLLRVARQRWRALFRRDAVDEELASELSFHIEQLTQEFVERGMSSREAQLAARRAVGNIPLLEEQSRDTRKVAWLHDVRQDVLYGARMLRRNPGFTVVALASLALGIGANTAILSVIDSVLRDRLTIPHDDRVVVLRTFPLDSPAQETHARIVDYFAWRDESRSFEVMGAAMGHNADFGADAGGTSAERIGGQSITADAFAALGVQPLLGRTFTVQDEEESGNAPARVIILSYQLWQRRYFGRPDVIGQQVRLDRINRTVVGVMPETFRYPNEQTSYWIPMRMERSQDRNPQRFFVVTARLKDDVTIEQAQSDLETIAARLAHSDPDRHTGWGVRVKPVRDAMFGWTRGRLYTLEGAVALVLLVACANVAGLLLARGLVRGPEIALRAALGAGRGRIVRQLLTESVLLSVGGGALGLVVAWVGIRALVAMDPPPGGVAIGDIALSMRTLGATAFIAIVTGMLYGLAPAFVHARASLTDTLKEPGGGTSSRRPRLRSTEHARGGANRRDDDPAGGRRFVDEEFRARNVARSAVRHGTSAHVRSAHPNRRLPAAPRDDRWPSLLRDLAASLDCAGTDLSRSARDSWCAGGGRRLHPSLEQHRGAIGEDQPRPATHTHGRAERTIGELRDRRRWVGLTPRRTAHADRDVFPGDA